MDILCFCSGLCLLCLCARLFICALWSPAGKGLTSSAIGILGQVWYLTVSIPDLCTLTYVNHAVSVTLTVCESRVFICHITVCLIDFIVPCDDTLHKLWSLTRAILTTAESRANMWPVKFM